jgi:hypothetical protein
MMKFPASSTSTSAFSVDHKSGGGTSPLCPHGRSPIICPYCKQAKNKSSNQQHNPEAALSNPNISKGNLLDNQFIVFLIRAWTLSKNCQEWLIQTVLGILKPQFYKRYLLVKLKLFKRSVIPISKKTSNQVYKGNPFN